jgi:hypothetical protein
MHNREETAADRVLRSAAALSLAADRDEVAIGCLKADLNALSY